MARRVCQRRQVFPGRAIDRPLIVAGSISTADGSVLVRMGKTIVVCGVKAEIAEPELDAPDLGFIGGSFDDTV